MSHHPIPSQSSQKGIVLLEALILIFSMGILAIAGLQAAMVKNTSDAKYRSDAAFIAQQRLGVMWSDPDNLDKYVELAPGTDISTLLPNGKRIVSLAAAGGEVKVVVEWQLPGQDKHNFTTIARITGG
jgi:type IV pilus assembly protein PilV